MGVCCTISRSNYCDCNTDEDTKIRNWEESKLKMNFNSFKSVQSKFQINCKKTNEIDLLSKLIDVFSSDVSDLVKNSQYFRTEKNLDHYKISVLLFLLSRDSFTESKIKLSDKSVYLFQEILSEPENDLSSAVEKNNPNLIKFLSTSLEITFDVLLPYFLNSEKVIELSGFSKYSKVDKKKLLEFVLSNLLFKQGQTNEVFTFEDLNKLFVGNKWILSTGYLRESSEQQGQ